MRILTFLAVLFCGCGPITFKATLSGEGVVQGSPLGALLDTFPAVSSFDLAPWVRKPATSLMLSGRGRQPSQDTTLEVVVELEVGASPF